MRSLSALLIVGFVAAGSLEPYSWTPSQEYRYKYSTQVFSGIPELNNQYSGLRLSTTVRIQPKQDSTLRIQLEQPRLASYNEKIEWDHEFKPSQSGEEVSIPSHIKTWLETPFSVYHKRGLVEKILTENGEPEFVVNIKKGLASQIQQDLSRAIETEQNQVRGQGAIIPAFQVNEASTVGKCETEYSISKLAPHLILQLQENELVRDSECEGKEHYEIIKTKDLQKCSDRPVFHKTIGVWSRNSGSESVLPSQSTVTRTIICGSIQNHIIRKSNTENRILVGIAGSINTEEKIQVSVYSTLKLESVERAQREIPEPSSPKGYPSLIFEYPSGSSTSSRSLKKELMQQDNQQQQQQQQQHQQQQQQLKKEQLHAPLPDLTSAPQVFHIKGSSQRELKQKAIEIITEMMEYAEKIGESSRSKKDVAGLSVAATKFISMLSLEELKEVEQTVISQAGRRGQQQLVKKAFFDLVSMAGTNPCIMLIKEKVTSGEVNEEPASWSWILSNALRSVQTPTPELLRELVQLAKSENIQKNRIIRAAYLMGLSNLINKACVNPVSIQSQFPYRIYGQMCNPETEAIKSDLIPFLAQKLEEASRENTNSVITFVFALGNIGTEESSKELLKVVEGKITMSPYPRSVAVYKLIKPAMINPTLYRPVFFSLIENSAEDPLVRMAAVTAIPYSAPSSADLQKLALRTWFEPSRQVSSYIYSTLKSLSQLSDSVPVYESIRNKAKIILPLAKHSKEGFQYSHNLQFTTFIETLQAAASHKLQWTASEESFIPRTIYAKAELKARAGKLNALESMFYIQGAETLIEKLYDLYDNMKVSQDQESKGQYEREVQEIIRKLGIQEKRSTRPEAHLNIKLMGMEKLYSIDEEMIHKIVSTFSSEVMENMEALERGLKMNFLKVLDLHSVEYALPTESGFPVYIAIRHPVVAYSDADVKVKRMSGSQPTLEVEMKAVANYKRQVHVGVMSVITNKFHGAALETSMHVALPLKADVTVRKGQVQVTIKQLEEPEYQREQQLLELDVQPFTVAHRLDTVAPMSKDRQAKTIESRQPKIERTVQIGRPMGLDVKLVAETEESGLDFYKLVGDLKTNLPIFLADLPTPITSGRRTTIKIFHDPRNSQVKELEFYLSADAAYKQKNQQIKQLLQPQNLIQQVHQMCQQYAPQQIQQCQSQLLQKQQQQDTDIIEECQEEQKLKQQQAQNQQQKQQLQQQQQQELLQQLQQQSQQQQQQQQQLQQLQQTQQQQQQQLLQQLQQQQQKQCLLPRQLCKEEKKLCIETLEKIGMNRDEVVRKCQRAEELCRQSILVKQQLQEKLLVLNEGRAAAVSVGVILRARQQSEEGRIEAHIAIAHKSLTKGLDKIHPTLKAVIKTPMLRQPFDLELEGEWEMKRPVQRWSLEEMINEDLTNKIYVNGVYGLRGEEKKSIKASVLLVKSEKHQNFVRSLEEFKMCSRDQSQGRMLTENCKRSRHYAATLDVAHTKLSIPKEIAQNPWARLATEAAKLVVLPYLSQRSIARRESGAQQEYSILAKVHGKGETFSVTISGNGEEVEVRNVRVGQALRGLLPICTRETLVQKIAQKLTAHNAPSSCVIEAGKVSTFDRFEYAYPLNDCEHVAFAERSNRPRIVVSTKKDQVKQHVKMIVDGHKFEVEIKKGSRYARDGKASIKINGQEKEVVSLEQQLQQQQQNQQQSQQLLQQQLQQQQQLLQQQQLQQNQQQLQQNQQLLQQQQLQQNQQLLQQLQKQQQLYKTLQQNIYEDQETIVSNYADGVYSIYSRKYQVEVIADGERLEVRSPQHIFRNRVTGICGDLNGEWSADMKSAKQCIVTKPKISAVSFMLEDGQCQGIPQQEKSELQRQEQRCIRQEQIPTKVSQIFRQYQESRPQPEQRHLVEEHKGKICFSKDLIRICSRSYPKQVVSKQVGFACVSGPRAQIIKNRVLGGDLVEDLERFPTEYIKTVHEPRQC